MDDRLLYVTEENRAHLARLLREGDPAQAEALTAYRAHLLLARNLARRSVPAEEIPSFFQSDHGRQVLSLAPRTLIALAASLMADKIARIRSQPRFAPLRDIDHLTERVLDRLAGRRLPFNADDAAVLVDLVAAYPWLEQIRVALNAARRVFESGEALRVVDALRRFDAVFTEEPKGLLVSKVMSYHHQVRALLAAQIGDGPAPVVTDDAFGPAALVLLREEHAEWDPVDVLAFLATPRGTRASRAWWEEAEGRASEPNFARLVVDLLDLVAEVDLTGGTQETHGFYHPDVVLLGEVNTIVVRGAAWSARFVTRPGAVPALGRAALRCSSLVRGPWGVDPMNSKVAYAAVDSLAALETEAAHGELQRLLTEVQAVQVLRRVAGHLGAPEPEIKAMIKARRPNRYVHRKD